MSKWYHRILSLLQSMWIGKHVKWGNYALSFYDIVYSLNIFNHSYQIPFSFTIGEVDENIHDFLKRYYFTFVFGLTNTLNFHWENVSSNIDYWFMFEISNRTMAYLSQRKVLFLHIHFSRTRPSYINQEESKRFFPRKKRFSAMVYV